MTRTGSSDGQELATVCSGLGIFLSRDPLTLPLGRSRLDRRIWVGIRVRVRVRVRITVRVRV